MFLLSSLLLLQVARERRASGTRKYRSGDACQICLLGVVTWLQKKFLVVRTINKCGIQHLLGLNINWDTNCTYPSEGENNVMGIKEERKRKGGIREKGRRGKQETKGIERGRKRKGKE